MPFCDTMIYMNKKHITAPEAERLVSWYEQNRRSLPWRDTGDPYHVWISEIMLQQTRIEAVRDKYIQFVRELPDIAALAACEDDRLMRLWEGLGYYSRARSLKKCAAVLMNEYDGRLPADFQALLKLPGANERIAARPCFIPPKMSVSGFMGYLKGKKRWRRDEQKPAMQTPKH